MLPLQWTFITELICENLFFSKKKNVYMYLQNVTVKCILHYIYLYNLTLQLYT